MNPRRGEIWLVELDPTRGSEMQKTRPCVVITSRSLVQMPIRIIVPLTAWQDRFAARPTDVFIAATAQNGLSKDSSANSIHVRCVASERLTKRIGNITADQLALVVAGVAVCIDYQP